MIKHKVTRKTKKGSTTYTRGNGMKSVAPGTSAMRPSGGHPGEEFAKKTSAKGSGTKSKKYSKGNTNGKGVISAAPGTAKMRPSGGHASKK